MLIKYSNLRPKDMEYMRVILQMGMVTAKQLNLYFEEKNMYSTWRRLRKLKDEKYIKQYQLTHGLVVYTGTPESRDATEMRATLPEGVSLYTARHTLLNNELIIYHKLQAKKHGHEFRFKTERELKFEAIKEEGSDTILKKVNENRERFPDCVFIVKSAEKTMKYWVELELSKKENKRLEEKFKKKFEQILSNGEYDQIWYFTDAEKIKNAINKAKKYLSQSEKLIVKDIPAVIKNDDWEALNPD